MPKRDSIKRQTNYLIMTIIAKTHAKTKIKILAETLSF